MQRRSSFKVLWVILSKSLSTTTFIVDIWCMWENHALSFDLGEMQTKNIYCNGFL